MLFNTSRNFDFPPEIMLPNANNFLEVVEHTRLLGIQVTTDLRWSEHSRYIIKKANSKLKFKEIFFNTIMNIWNEGSKQNLQSHNIYKEDQERDDPSTNDIWLYYSIVSRLS